MKEGTNMRKPWLAAMILSAILACGGSAWALTINGGTIDVGGVDTKIGETTLLSGAAAELSWVQSILGSDITFITKHEVVAGDWAQTSQSGVWAYALADTPDYFLVKTGNNGTNNFCDYLFANNDADTWAVLNLADVYVASVTNIGKVSHLSDFNGSDTPVPEPATILLLGGGLLGVAVYRRKRAKE